MWYAGFVLAVAYLWLRGDAFRRQRDAAQRAWVEDSLEKQERLEAAYGVIETLVADELAREHAPTRVTLDVPVPGADPRLN